MISARIYQDASGARWHDGSCWLVIDVGGATDTWDAATEIPASATAVEAVQSIAAWIVDAARPWSASAATYWSASGARVGAEIVTAPGAAVTSAGASATALLAPRPGDTAFILSASASGDWQATDYARRQLRGGRSASAGWDGCVYAATPVISTLSAVLDEGQHAALADSVALCDGAGPREADIYDGAAWTRYQLLDVRIDARPPVAVATIEVA